MPCVYATQRVVVIKSKTLFALYHGAMLLIVGYVVGIVLIYNKGYQFQDTPIGLSSFKARNSAYYNTSTGFKVMDAVDIVQPPMENDALFLTTGVESLQQTRGVCPGVDKDTEKCPCTRLKSTTYGLETGNCSADGEFCDLYAWCPPEPDLPPHEIIDVTTMSVFIKMTVDFPRWHINTANGNKIQPGVNQFSVADIMKSANVSYADVAERGALFAALTDWTCNLDYDLSLCEPTVSFVRLDDPQSKLSSGFNFRTVSQYAVGNTLTRTLSKLYGLRFVVIMSGAGGKFDFVTLLVNIGAGIGLLGTATIVSDFMAMYLLPRRYFYKNCKYLELEDEDGDLNLGVGFLVAGVAGVAVSTHNPDGSPRVSKSHKDHKHHHHKHHRHSGLGHELDSDVE